MSKSKIAVAIAAAMSSMLVTELSLAAAEKLEETIVTGQLGRFGATKSATPILETARSIVIETEAMFREKGALTIDDALNYSAGVAGDVYGFSTRGDFPKVRGFNAAEYRDGQQVLFGTYNNTRSDIYMLEQVEVLKGPASVLYGKGTPGGIVNAISKVAGPNKENEIVVDAGSNDRLQFAADLNAQINDNLFLRAVGVYRDSDTQIDHVQDDAVTFMPSITYQNDTSSLTAMIEIVNRDSDTSGQFLPLEGTACVNSDVTIKPEAISQFVCANATGEELNASTYHGHPDFNRYNSDSTLASILGNHVFNDQLSIEGVVRYKEAEVDYRQAWVDFTGGGPRTDANGNAPRTWYLSDASSEQIATDIRLRWETTTGALNHEIFVGTSYQYVTTDNDTTYLASQDIINIYNPVNGPIPAAFVSGKPAYNAPQTINEEHGVYVSNQISIDNWKINLGLRYDDVRSASKGSEGQGNYALSGSAGLLYAFDTGISPYISWAESFEPVLGTDGLTNETLKPREGEQIEVGIKYQPPGTATFITVAYFDIEETNLPNPASLITQPNSQQEGKGSSKGFELEGQTTWGDMSLEVNIALLDTESADGVEFSSIPEKQFSSWLNWRPSSGALQGFKTGAGVRYMGENTSNAVAVGAEIITDGYIVYDAMIGYELAQWDLTLNIRNLTNESYYGTCLTRGDCFPGEERSAVARAAYRF